MRAMEVGEVPPYHLTTMDAMMRRREEAVASHQTMDAAARRMSAVDLPAAIHHLMKEAARMKEVVDGHDVRSVGSQNVMMMAGDSMTGGNPCDDPRPLLPKQDVSCLAQSSVRHRGLGWMHRRAGHLLPVVSSLDRPTPIEIIA